MPLTTVSLITLKTANCIFVSCFFCVKIVIIAASCGLHSKWGIKLQLLFCDPNKGLPACETLFFIYRKKYQNREGAQVWEMDFDKTTHCLHKNSWKTFAQTHFGVPSIFCHQMLPHSVTTISFSRPVITELLFSLRTGSPQEDQITEVVAL